MGATLSIDHLVLSVPDVEEAVRRLHDDYGLGCSRNPAGRPETAVCPLGGAYLRVVNGGHASPFLAWVAATPELAPFVQRAGEPRACPWEDDLIGVGLDLLADGLLPPVVSRRARWLHPSGRRASSPAHAVGITCLELRGAAADLHDWLGDAADELPLKLTPGPRRLLAAIVATVDGDKRLTSTALAGTASLAAAGERGLT